MCLSKNYVYTGINGVVLAFYSKAACIVNVCTCKVLNCYCFYFLLCILWLQLNLTALCYNQGRHPDHVETNFTTNITLNISSDAAGKSNLFEAHSLTAGRKNKICIRILKEDPQSMQQGPELQCNKTRIYQDQEINYTCTFGKWSVCRNACDITNDSGELRSFFLLMIILILIPYTSVCLIDSNMC